MNACLRWLRHLAALSCATTAIVAGGVQHSSAARPLDLDAAHPVPAALDAPRRSGLGEQQSPGLDRARPSDLVNRRLSGRVVNVVDGDTVDVVLAGGRRVRVRIHGIDAPERGEPYSQQALAFARVSLFTKEVTIDGRDVDPYDRLVARVIVEGEDVSETILAAGLACHFTRYSDDPVLAAAESNARAARRGFWAPGASQPACVQRAAAAARDDGAAEAAIGFTGNVNSRVYHAPTCRNAQCKNCTRRFATRAEAEAAGFRPAGDCLR